MGDIFECNFAPLGMEYSYSSASNDSEQQNLGNQLMPEVNINNDHFFAFPSSYDSNTTAWTMSPGPMDDFPPSSLPTETQFWSNTTTATPTGEWAPPFTIPIHQTNPADGLAHYKSHCMDDGVMTTLSATPSVQSTSPPEKPSRSCTCEICKKTFTRVADVRRHVASVHNPVLEDCPVQRCTRKGKNGLTRKDHLKEHMRSYHHIYIPKRVVAKKKLIKDDAAPFTAQYPYPS